MNEKQQLTLQKTIINFFEKESDATLIHFIDSFAYQKPAHDNATSELITRFLKENGLEEAYMNCMIELKTPSQFFSRASMSEKDMIHIINMALLNAAFNRFRQTI